MSASITSECDASEAIYAICVREYPEKLPVSYNQEEGGIALTELTSQICKLSQKMMGSSRWKIAVMVFLSVAEMLMPIEADEHEHTVR
jgi:hypothetical protein